MRESALRLAPHPIGEIEFKELRVPAEDMIGSEGDGYQLAMKALDTFRASVGAAACGIAPRALDEAIAYAKTRKQFKMNLSHHQISPEKLAHMLTELVAARSLVFPSAYLNVTCSAPATAYPTQAIAN